MNVYIWEPVGSLLHRWTYIGHCLHLVALRRSEKFCILKGFMRLFGKNGQFRRSAVSLLNSVVVSRNNMCNNLTELELHQNTFNETTCPWGAPETMEMQFTLAMVNTRFYLQLETLYISMGKHSLICDYISSVTLIWT